MKASDFIADFLSKHSKYVFGGQGSSVIKIKKLILFQVKQNKEALLRQMLIIELLKKSVSQLEQAVQVS